MHRKRIAPILVVLATVALPAGASAHRPPAQQHPTTDPVTLALKLGEGFWEKTPCDGQITMKSEALAYTPTSQSGVAAAGLANETLAPIMRSEWGRNLEGDDIECEIKVNSRAWPNWLAMDRTFHWFCDAITHELGHFFGLRDDEATDPAWINYPILEPGSPNYDSVPPCRHVILWYGGEAVRES